MIKNVKLCKTIHNKSKNKFSNPSFKLFDVKDYKFKIPQVQKRPNNKFKKETARRNKQKLNKIV